MTLAFSPLLNRLLQSLLVIALALASAGAVWADDDDDDDDDDGGDGKAAVVFADDWRPVLELRADQSVANLYLSMGRVGPGAQACPADADPLLARPLPDLPSRACVRLINNGAVAGVWRVDFEDVRGPGRSLELASAGAREVVFAYPSVGEAAARITAPGRLASLPILLGPGEEVVLFATLQADEDLEDADPVLRPEAVFDQARRDRARGNGALLGATAVLLMMLLALAHLLSSTPARWFALYFVATCGTFLTSTGAVDSLIGGNPTIAVGLIEKALQAILIGAHILFMAAFLRDAGAARRLSALLAPAGVTATALLVVMTLGVLLLAETETLLPFLGLGFELDPLVEAPLESPAMTLSAAVTAFWFLAIAATAVALLRARAKGAVLFSLGGAALVIGMVGDSFADALLAELGDDSLLPQTVLLADALLFSAAMLWQIFGLRADRDRALRRELEASQEQVRLTETLLQSRSDLQRARDLAETHRSRLALTGHDLRQPLTSLALAADKADAANPELGEALRSSLDFMRDVLNETVADTRPGTAEGEADLSEDEGGYHTVEDRPEPVEVAVLTANALRMFGPEAKAKGLELRAEPTDLSIVVEPLGVFRSLSNLVSNAVKYTHSGEIVLRARSDDGGVAIEVVDTGPGLDEAEIAEIRQSYRRGATAGDVAGDGLGLSSVDRFAQEAGGWLEITSVPGQGSCFAIVGLPPA